MPRKKTPPTDLRCGIACDCGASIEMRVSLAWLAEQGWQDVRPNPDVDNDDVLDWAELLGTCPACVQVVQRVLFP